MGSALDTTLEDEGLVYCSQSDDLTGRPFPAQLPSPSARFYDASQSPCGRATRRSELLADGGARVSRALPTGAGASRASTSAVPSSLEEGIHRGADAVRVSAARVSSSPIRESFSGGDTQARLASPSPMAQERRPSVWL